MTPQARARLQPVPDVEKQLPQNVEAETALIGMAASGEFGDILAEVSFLEPRHFYLEWHRTVWKAVESLHADGVEINFLSLHGKLKEWDVIGHGQIVDSISDVTECVNHLPPNAAARSLAESVYRTALRRWDIHRAHQLANAAYSGDYEQWQCEREETVTYFADGDAGNAGRNASGKKTPYHLLSIKEVMNQPRPDPLIDGYYSLDSTSLTYAPPGVGKTVLLLDQMAHVALSWAWECHAVKGGHVVYICAEGQAFLPERLQALMLKLDVDDIPRLHILEARPQLLQPQTVTHLLTTFEAELSEPPVWIAFDTVSQTASGARENDADAMGPYLAAMERIREKTGAFVHAIHHTGKDESRGARGSSVFLGNCDTVTYITKVDETCLWKCEKQRGGWAPFKPFAFRVKSLALDDFADHTGPYIEACDVPAEAPSQPRAPKGQAKKVYDIFLSQVRQNLDGVSFSTWEKACGEAGIPQSTFKDARKKLAEDFKVVYQPEGDDRWHPTPGAGAENATQDEPEKPKGQNGANGPASAPVKQPQQSEGQKGQSPLERLAPLALVDESDSANGDQIADAWQWPDYCAKTATRHHEYNGKVNAIGQLVCIGCGAIKTEVPA